jgi:RNA polymerase sigma-70 factor (ECF subfamily)
VTSDRQSEAASEHEWVCALKRRDAWAWERLQERALDPVFAYVYLRCDRREDAEDVTAEVFAAAVGAIDRFRGDGRLVTWLIGIARRKLIDAGRRRRRRPEVLASEVTLPGEEHESGGLVLEPPDPETPHSLLEQRERLAGIRNAVLRLPEVQREVLLLRCIDQLALGEIARLLGRSEDAVKGLLRRARTALQQELEAADQRDPGRQSEQRPAGRRPPASQEAARVEFHV